MNFNSRPEYYSLANLLESIGYVVDKYIACEPRAGVKIGFDYDGKIYIGFWNRDLIAYEILPLEDAMERLPNELQEFIIYNLELFI